MVLAAAIFLTLLLNEAGVSNFLEPSPVFSQGNPSTYSLVSDATMLILSGRVELQSGANPFTIVTDNTPVVVGDRVRTGPDGFAVVTYFEGSTTTIEPNSEVQLNRLDKLPE